MNNELKKELEAISPYLSRMKEKPEHCRVPEGFFEGVQESVFAKLKNDYPNTSATAEKVVAPQGNNLLKRLLSELEWIFASPLALATSSFAAVLLMYWWQFHTTIADNCTQFACVPDTEIQQYLEQHLDEFEIETLWSATATENGSEAYIQDPEKTQDSAPELKAAGENEVQQLLEEMIDKGEISEDDLKDII